MKKLEFNSTPEYLEYIEGLAGRPSISEIFKKETNNYFFKIGNSWYNLLYKELVGTNWALGPTLLLKGGNNSEETEILYSKQITAEERINKIFERLEQIYIQHLAIDNTKTKDLIISLLEFLDRDIYIEKYSSNIFVITKEDIKYYFIKYEDYSRGLFLQRLQVKKVNGDDEKVIGTFRKEYEINSIIGFLELVYYSSRLNDISQIKELIEKQLQ